MTIILLLVTLLLSIILGMPIAWALITCGIVMMSYLGFFSDQVIAQNLILGTDNFILLAIPFFILAGELMNKGGLSRNIINFAMALVGHIRGGLGYAGIAASLVMASLSGSAIADSAALAAILIPMMKAARYPAGKSGGLLAAGGVIAPVIPPSIALVVYGAISNTSISALFMAAVVPGLLLGISLIFVWFWVAPCVRAVVTRSHSGMIELAGEIGRRVELFTGTKGSGHGEDAAAEQHAAGPAGAGGRDLLRDAVEVAQRGAGTGPAVAGCPGHA